MKIRTYIFLLTAVLFVLITLKIANDKKKPQDTPNAYGVIKTEFFDEQAFVMGTSKVGKVNNNTSYDPVGGIVPHHQLASYLIADFFNRLSIKKPNTIIILGPNHEEIGDAKVITTDYSWQTPYGQLDSEAVLVGRMVSQNLARLGHEVVAKDQSISPLTSYIQFYMPGVRIVPLLISSKMNESDISQLSEFLSEVLLEDGNFLAVSADFSHYLGYSEAQARDEETLKAIQDFDCRSILRMDSKNLDSPPSVCVLLNVMQNLERREVEVIGHDNSYNIQKQDRDNTTSYYTIFAH